MASSAGSSSRGPRSCTTCARRGGEARGPPGSAATVESLLFETFELPPYRTFVLPLPHVPDREGQLRRIAGEYLDSLVDDRLLKPLGDLTGREHLIPHLRTFMEDHPQYERNVFVMMRFSETPRHQEVHAAIGAELTDLGMVGLRADTRDYTGELWSNIEVYLLGCMYGIAVFEDFEQTRDFNPNVSLELGYMMGRSKRTLLLKEERLPSLPADVVHRLYKSFDQFDITATVRAQVRRFVTTDLGL